MPSYSRRDFLRRTVAGAAATELMMNGACVPLEATPMPKPAEPADRVNVGFIGIGIRGSYLMEQTKKTGQANLVAACDCYQGYLDRAKERTGGKIDTVFAQYKKLLERKDLDAVVIATPDHWHVPMVLDALAAGKDVYIEKPMTHVIAEGPKLIEAAKRSKQIIQVGSQWISGTQNEKAKELVAAGRLGQITKIAVAYNRNDSSGAWNYPIPPDLKNGVNFNWEEWLGPAPPRSFDAERVFRYRKYWDYSGGISTDLFVHLINSIHYIMDVKMPASVVATGGILRWKDGREVPDTLDALFAYAEGFFVAMGCTMNNAGGQTQGFQFLGTEGTLNLALGGDMSFLAEEHREGYPVDHLPLRLQDEFMSVGTRRQEKDISLRPPRTYEAGTTYRNEGPDPVVLHLSDFFECVRSRRQPLEGPEMGHRSAAAGHMVNLAYQSGKKVHWDSVTGTVRS